LKAFEAVENLFVRYCPVSVISPQIGHLDQIGSLMLTQAAQKARVEGTQAEEERVADCELCRRFQTH
jgi:hypothetical protein